MAELQDVQASETQYVNSLTVMLLVFKTYLDHRDTKAESVWLERKKGNGAWDLRVCYTGTGFQGITFQAPLISQVELKFSVCYNVLNCAVCFYGASMNFLGFRQKFESTLSFLIFIANSCVKKRGNTFLVFVCLPL